MVQTDFTIAMVTGVLIIIAIFLFILFKIFGKKKKNMPIETVLPDIDKIEPREFQPEKFGIRPQGIEGLNKEFQPAHELQKKGSVIEIMGQQKEDISSVEPEKPSISLNETAQIPKEKKEETLSNEENENLKLEDVLIETRDEKTKKKSSMKRSSSKNLEKAVMVKEGEVPEKKPMKSPVRKKREKDHVPEQVLKESKEKSPRKKPGKKGSTKIITQAIVNENPESGEL